MEIEQEAEKRQEAGAKEGGERLEEELRSFGGEPGQAESGGGAKSESEEDFGFREKDQAEAKAGRGGEGQSLLGQPSREKSNGNNGENEAVEKLVAIGRDEVVVADVVVLGEGEGEDDGQADGGGGKRVGGGEEGPVNGKHKQSCKQQVGDNQAGERNARKAENDAVEILRKRTAGEVTDIAVKDAAGGDFPGKIELEAEVDEGIGPFAPAQQGGEDEGRDDDNRAEPL